jgi:hypothetical protein
MTATSMSSSSEAALAAAEAGVQEYRNYLDNVPAYYTHNYGSPAGDAALTGWKQIGATDEWFHYVPDPSRLTVSSGGSAGQMLLEVTGRAGAPGAYAYRTMLTSFKLSGILTDSYYSEYELAQRHRHARFGFADDPADEPGAGGVHLHQPARRLHDLRADGTERCGVQVPHL